MAPIAYVIVILVFLLLFIGVVMGAGIQPFVYFFIGTGYRIGIGTAVLHRVGVWRVRCLVFVVWCFHTCCVLEP